MPRSVGRFMRVVSVLAFYYAGTLSARAAEVIDATGRTVTVPDEIHSVLPAGPPAAVLLELIAPDLMLGWPHPPSPEAARYLPDEVAHLPQVPSISATAAIVASHPDLILDYGTVEQPYIGHARNAQRATGVPTILLDGKLALTPLTFRLLGRLLHREARGEQLASLAEGVLASVGPRRSGLRVAYVHGPEGNELAVPGGNNSELPELLGWTLVAPEPVAEQKRGAFQPATIAQIAMLDPDLIIFADPAMRERVAATSEWRALRAVREHHAWASPSLPFGWVEGPPSVNRLLGLAWLGSGEPSPGVVPFAAAFHAAAYGRVPTPRQIAALRDQLRPIEPLTQSR